MELMTKTRSSRRSPARGADDGDCFLEGQLLIAMPSMTEPPFAGTVIYLCAHNADGAMGLVLNRPLRQPSFDDLLGQLGVEPAPPHRRLPLHAGGPVDAARGFVLHSTDWTGRGSLRVKDDIALTASLEVLTIIARGAGPRQALLALGYAGWGAGQLDREISENSWLSVPASAELVFGSDHAGKWRQAMAVLQIDPLLLSVTAGHA